MNSKPNSFVIFIGMSWNQGAVSQQFQSIAHELVNLGHQVVILMDYRKKNLESADSNPALYSWLSPRPTHLQDALLLQKLIWKYQPDCMISQFGSENLFLFLGWLNKISCRVTWHHSILENPKNVNYKERIKRSYFTWRKRTVLRLATKIVSVSDAAGKDANKVFSVPLEKIITMHNSLKDPLPDIHIKAKLDRNRITCTSALVDAKGQETLLHAIALIHQDFPAIVVDFIGAGDSREKLKKLSQSLMVEEKCLFSGLVSYKEVLSRMHNSYLTVFPTRSEAFGLVAIESMAVGTPVIASNVGGLPEIIQDGVEGFLFPVGDHRILAEKISMLLSDLELRTKMGHNARKKYLSDFNLEEKSKQYAVQIEDLIKVSLTQP